MTAFAFKSDTLYIACSPEFGVFSYGHCQDEALNNLTDEIRDRGVGESTGNDKDRYALN
jgi:hypothetical protein